MMQLILLVWIIGQPVYEIEEIVVTATRYPAALREVAVATAVIKGEDIQSIVPLGFDEVMRSVSGIEYKGYGLPGSVDGIALRGISTTGTLVLLNGHPLNSLTLGMADIGIVDVNAIERIEIVKGPVASLYGANALGGVVNIITRKKRTRPYFLAKIMPSTTTLDVPFQSNTFFAKVALPYNRVQVDISGGRSASDGYRSNSDMVNYTMMADVAYTIPAVDVHGTVMYHHKRHGVPGPLPLLDSMHVVPLLGDSTATSLFDREEDNAATATFQCDWAVSGFLKLTSTVFGDRRLTHYHTAFTNWPADTMIEDYDYTTYTLGTHMRILVGLENVDVVIGLDAHYDTLEAIKESADTGDTTWSVSSYTVGGWLELCQEFNDRVSITSSARYDINSDYGNFWTPGIGLVAVVHPNLVFKLSAGKTFRAPTFNDLYWPLYGNQDLKPEHGWAYEMRTEYSPLPTISGALSLFIRNVHDQIAWSPSEDGFWKPQNINKLEVRGVEFELTQHVGTCVEIGLITTILDALQDNDEITYDYYDWLNDTTLTVVESVRRKAAFTPRYSVALHLDVRSVSGWQLHSDGSFIHERINYYANYGNYPHVTMDTKTLPAYMLFNVTIGKLIGHHITVAGGVKNLTDVTYAIQFGNSVDDRDYPMPGRTYFAQLTIRY